MKISIIGGGPAGLYFAILAKKSWPDWDISIIERNRPDDTFGFGGVLSDQTLGAFQVNHPEGFVPGREEAGQQRVVGQLQPDGFTDPGRVPEAAGDDSQRSPRPQAGVFEDKFHRTVHLRHDGIHAAPGPAWQAPIPGRGKTLPPRPAWAPPGPGARAVPPGKEQQDRRYEVQSHAEGDHAEQDGNLGTGVDTPGIDDRGQQHGPEHREDYDGSHPIEP